MLLCVPALFATSKTAPASSQAVQRWSPQNLNGTISMVDPNMDLVVVKDQSGVPFDITVSRKTRIDKGTTREQLAQLTPNESVSVHYIPEARGDIARTIEINH